MWFPVLYRLGDMGNPYLCASYDFSNLSLHWGSRKDDLQTHKNTAKTSRIHLSLTRVPFSVFILSHLDFGVCYNSMAWPSLTSVPIKKYHKTIFKTALNTVHQVTHSRQWTMQTDTTFTWNQVTMYMKTFQILMIKH